MKLRFPMGLVGCLAMAACFDFSVEQFCLNNPAHPQCVGSSGDGGSSLDGSVGSSDGGRDAGQGGGTGTGTGANDGGADAGGGTGTDAGAPDPCEDAGYSNATSWFVTITGSDSNMGTMASPFQSISRALTAARSSVTRKRIVLEEGIYSQGTIGVDAGWVQVSIEGAGVSNGSAAWSRDCSANRRASTRLEVSAPVGLRAEGVSLHLQDLELVTGNALSASSPSAYGLWGSDAALTLSNVRVRAGAGLSPSSPPQPMPETGVFLCNKSMPNTGDAGVGGATGSASSAGTFAAVGYQVPAGGSGGQGGIGVTGTPGGNPGTGNCVNCNCTNCGVTTGVENGSVGQPGCGGNGGAAGAGASGGGASVALFVSGGSQVTLAQVVLETSAGGRGVIGGAGGLGAAGGAGAVGAPWCYTQSVCHGSGGGGPFCQCVYEPTSAPTRTGGAAGGAGGPGGQGGRGGTGAGGWSVALVASSSASLSGLDGGVTFSLGAPGITPGGAPGQAMNTLTF